MPHHFEADLVLPVIGRIYDAALNPHAWPDAIAQIASLYESDKAYLFTPQRTVLDGGVVFTVGISEAIVQQYAAKYAAHDVWTQATVEKGLLVEGTVITDEDLCPHEDFLKTVFYRDFLSPQGIARVCSGVIFGTDSTGMPPTGLSVFRGLRDKAFGDRERAIKSVLIPHLSRALGIMFRLRDAELKMASTLAGFDRLASGVALLGRRGEVIFANRALRSLLQRESGLRLRADMHKRTFLEASDPNDQRALTVAIQQSIDPNAVNVAHFSKAVRITRRSDLPPYTLNFSALPEHNEFGFASDRPCAIVFVTDPAEPVRVNAEVLKRLYGLTPSECRLAARLCDGETLSAIAVQLGVREATVKTHLQSIFNKTQTRRQVQLVRLLVSLASSAD